MNDLYLKKSLNFTRGRAFLEKHESVILDFDEEGNIINLEIFGYSHIAGRPPNNSEMEWLASQAVNAIFSPEDDVMSITAGFGENCIQKTSIAKFGFDGSGNLVEVSVN
ncbi:DUF2283 domain-containing protein [Xanthomonas hortorum]|uniref:DUF2283 domain-containing protein n=1 Tax=Xanthomonas hortorum TaxID=56454 RepID=A0AA47EUJ6_9XANT|nr:DUF2283 domain-containing protein [Xanthomonas hortorum]WAH64601.1 DUF2283 domain-containing protein [Xanthomonas hortorum]WAH64602.1 DUF2283 domain-containing protein [Xanthomonas hortorum]WAH64603.1 DUF2283 domain-containing protein [Xanthomonas hortorum]